MADEFHTGICSGNWWNSSRGEFSDSSTPCSTALSDVGSFGWVETTETSTKSRSCEDSASVSGNSIPFQHTQRSQVADSIGSAGTGSFLIDSTAQMMGFGHSFPPTSDWSQTLLRGSARAESSFQAMLQDDQSSSLRANYPHETVTCQGFPSNSFSMDSATYGCPSTVLQGLYEHNTQPQQATFDNRSMNYPSSITYRENSSNEFSSPWSDIPHFLRNSSSSQKQQLSNQLHFSNNTPFWNASASAMNEVRSSLYPSSQTQFLAPIFDEKPSCSHLLAKPKLEEAHDTGSTLKKSSSEPTYKRPRIETPSPLPTFKVRKEKLGDRITALQQLVSPFGKTDTASVLYEAIEYIKFLHEQVSVLSESYMKNAMPTQHPQQNSDKSKEAQGTNQDLRSRGLCLVPISSIIPVTNNTPTDFWTPTYGGSFR